MLHNSLKLRSKKVASLLSSAMLLLPVMLGVVGCQRSTDQYLEQRAELLLRTEPEGVVSLEEAKQMVEQEPGPVVFLGRISADAGTTWERGRAAFVVEDPVGTIPVASDEDGDADDAHAHQEHAHSGHDASNCPFCSAKSTQPLNLALVQMVDKSGNVIEVDARELLAVREEQLVVVQGQGHVDELGHLVVDADGIYLRR